MPTGNVKAQKNWVNWILIKENILLDLDVYLYLSNVLLCVAYHHIIHNISLAIHCYKCPTFLGYHQRRSNLLKKGIAK